MTMKRIKYQGRIYVETRGTVSRPSALRLTTNQVKAVEVIKRMGYDVKRKGSGWAAYSVGEHNMLDLAAEASTLEGLKVKILKIWKSKK